MIAEKIDSVNARLGELGGRVDPETWAVLRAARNELADAAESARNLEALTEAGGGQN